MRSLKTLLLLLTLLLVSAGCAKPGQVKAAPPPACPTLTPLTEAELAEPNYKEPVLNELLEPSTSATPGSDSL